MFSRKPIDLSNGWDSLKGKQVGTIIGAKIVEKNMPKEARLTKVENRVQLLKLLENDKVGYLVVVRSIGEEYLYLNGISDIFSSDTVLSSVPGYMYLNKNHSELVVKISQSLRNMKEDGSFRKIVETHIPNYKNK
ncbi:MAG: transporter substrate-binding domain-containing protein [Pseudomonadales bacterium]|nr:transporter substrate-binding domain-containing protein [Pseudomonadales bacterium]